MQLVDAACAANSADRACRRWIVVDDDDLLLKGAASLRRISSIGRFAGDEETESVGRARSGGEPTRERIP
jgi:hypothetical protein